jgi:hypothetical protein
VGIQFLSNLGAILGETFGGMEAGATGSFGVEFGEEGVFLFHVPLGNLTALLVVFPLFFSYFWMGSPFWVSG